MIRSNFWARFAHRCLIGLKDMTGAVLSAQDALVHQQMSRPGGMVAFELKEGMEAGIRFLNGLKPILRAVSLGDCESLAQHSASMTHSAYSAEERQRHHISDGLIRLSAGLEDIEDLKAEIHQALMQCQ